jgi:diacylglycerol kinase family enzyme
MDARETDAWGTDTVTAGATPGLQHPTSIQRLAAAVALLALVGAVVVVALSLLGNLGRLVLVLVLVALAVTAAWTALVHRGVRRWLAAGLALVALVAVVLLLDVTSLVRIGLVVGLVVLSTAAARVAIGHHHAPSAAGRPVGPAPHGVLLMNPRSGGGKVEQFDLENQARRRGIEPIVLRPGDDLRALAEQAVTDGADVLGMAGGDGSQALVADVARSHDVALVCVPAGTRNHFALDLGLDRADVVAALDAFGDAVERHIDLALMGDRVFVNNASLGVYATVVRSEAYRDAKLATTAQMLPDLLGPDAKPFTLPDGQQQSSADIVLVSNNVYRLESLRGFGTRARIDDGQLGVVTVSVDRAVDLPALMSAEATGQVHRFRGYRAWSATEFVVDSSEPLIDVGVDGEALRLPPPLRFRCLQGCLRVRTPVSAPGFSPAAARPSVAEGVLALLRILAGHPAVARGERQRHPDNG